MPESNNHIISMAQQFSGLPMGALIGGPLKSAAEANAQMATTQVEFMLNTCFNEVSTGEGENKVTNYDPVMVNMTLTRGVLTETHDSDGNPQTDIQNVRTNFALPLLTIIPLNSLAVDSVDVDFMMEVKSSTSTDNSKVNSSSTNAEGGFSGGGGFGPFQVSVHGSISHKNSSESKSSSHYQASNSATYNVKVHAGQLPLPKGVNVIIDTYAQNVTPIQMPAIENRQAGGQGGSTPPTPPTGG